MMMKLVLFFILYFAIYMAATRGAEGLEFNLNAAEDADDHLADRAAAYRNFIGSLRDLLAGSTRVHGFRVLRDASTLQNRPCFLQFQLVNYGECRVTVVIDIVNVYVVGFIAANVRRHFEHTRDGDYRALFPGSQHISFGSGYVSLERRGGNRAYLPLGLAPLDIAISQLHHITEESDLARPLLVIIQMISEAVRFESLEVHIAQSIREGLTYRLSPILLEAQNNWGRLSQEIQDTQDGAFQNAVQATYGGERLFNIMSIAHPILVTLIGMLLHSNQNQRCGPNSIGDFEQACLAQVIGRIAGFDGRCLEATENSGLPNLHLSPCNNQEPNQEWTFQMDGTILWKKEYCIGIKINHLAEVILMDCEMPGVGQWMITPEGMVFERRTNLFLTAPNLVSLVLSKDQQQSGQFWAFDTSIHPVMVKIIGFDNGYCMEFDLSSHRLYMAPCKDIETQMWSYYPDHTIRPTPHLCITVEVDHLMLLVISECNGG